MKFKPIDTYYKNYKFRSRHEARWAVFYDFLGIKWEYEIEGFELPPYKFDKATFVEKNKKELQQNEECVNSLLFLADSLEELSKKPLRYLPDFWLPDYGCWAEIKQYSRLRENIIIDFEKLMRFVNYIKQACLLCSGFEKPVYVLMPNEEMGLINYYEFSFSDDKKRIEQAIRKANNARFEFGEKP